MKEFNNNFFVSPHEFVTIDLNDNQENVHQGQTNQKISKKNTHIKPNLELQIRISNTITNVPITVHNAHTPDSFTSLPPVRKTSCENMLLKNKSNRINKQHKITNSRQEPSRLVDLPPQRFHIPNALFSSNKKQIKDQNALLGFTIVENWSVSCSIDIFDILTDMQLFHIDMDLFSIFPTYRIIQHDKEIAKCTMIGENGHKIFFIYKRKDKKEEISILGNFLGHQYDMKRYEQLVAKVSPEKWAHAHCFGLQVMPGEDVLHAIAALIVVERCVQNMRDEQIL
jgi:uncharacterized protein YxjI